MPADRSKFTMRMSFRELEQIDALVTRHGFKTRSAFLVAAGLAYGTRQGNEEHLQRLAKVSYELHRLVRGNADQLSPREVRLLVSEVRRTMRDLQNGAG